MSWSAYGKIVNGVSELQTLTPPLASDETVEQWETAVAAAEAIVASGTVGDRNGSYKVILTGHANTEHLPTAGWANDSITVTVTQQEGLE